MGYVVSEISAASPDMSDDAFAAFVEDVRQNGQLVPIWVRGGEVIDGRKRLRACEQLGVEPKVIDVNPEQDAAALSRSLNALRTHYTPSQLAMYAAERATRPSGLRDQVRKNPLLPPTLAQVAAEVGVDRSMVSRAKEVRREAAPEVTAAVKAGDLTLHAAKQISEGVPKPQQPAAVKKVVEASKGKARHTPAAAVLSNRASQAGLRVFKSPPLASQWKKFLNQAEFAADNMEATADRAADLAGAGQWAERVRGVRATLTKVIRLLEGGNE